MKSLAAALFGLVALATSATSFEITPPVQAYYTGYSASGDMLLAHGHHSQAPWGYPPYTGCNDCGCGAGWTRGMQAWSGYCDEGCGGCGGIGGGCANGNCGPAINQGACFTLPRLNLFGHNDCNDDCRRGLLGDFRPFAWIGNLFHHDRDNDCCYVMECPIACCDTCTMCDECASCGDSGIGGIEGIPHDAPMTQPEVIQPAPRRGGAYPGPLSTLDYSSEPAVGPRLLPTISFAREL